VRSAQAAARGVTGVANILEGEVGFGAALAGNPDWKGATSGLGRDYNIGRITQKAHACCGHTFAAVDAAVTLRDISRFDARTIRSVEVETYQVAIDVTGNCEPRTAFEAKFSLPYVVAHALVHGSVRLNAFERGRLEDEALRALMQKVRLKADPVLSAGFPTKRSALVRLELTDGRVLEHFSPYRKGDPEAPLSDAEIDAKFLELVPPVLGAAGADRLLGQLWRLDTLPASGLALGAGARA